MGFYANICFSFPSIVTKLLSSELSLLSINNYDLLSSIFKTNNWKKYDILKL